jgi:hypothetical protein
MMSKFIGIRLNYALPVHHQSRQNTVRGSRLAARACMQWHVNNMALR